MNKINKVSVLGAGTMGSAIAQVCAMAGFKVQLWDIAEEQRIKAHHIISSNLDKGIARGKISEEQKQLVFSNIQTVSELNELNSDLIIEAVIEKLEVKVELFRKLQNQLGQNAILATNTSSIPITEIGSRLEHPAMLAGLHFFNPAHIMKLVEIISGAETSDQVTSLLKEFTEKIGKVGVVANDAPGFIVNRVARHFYVEGLKVLEEEVCGHEGIDRLVESSGFKLGPFRLMDLIGVDTNYSVTESMYRSFNYDQKFRPNRIQYMKVLAGHHGKKSGKGFYSYE